MFAIDLIGKTAIITGSGQGLGRATVEALHRAGANVVITFNSDGRADIACSSAHEIGIWWLQQLADGGWIVHDIDSSFSQSHSMGLGDINGDGKPDLVTGKRWWAHGPSGDIQADRPAVIYWFELRQQGRGQPTWTPHLINDHSGVGTQFELADVNGDGLLDVATSNKKGVFLFLQDRE